MLENGRYGRLVPVGDVGAMAAALSATLRGPRNSAEFVIRAAAFGEDLAANIATVERLVRSAAKQGAQVILPSELFQGPYFCTSQEE